jgi:hypothetical protein
MSQEITLTTKLSVANGGFKCEASQTNTKINQATAGGVQFKVSVPAADTVITTSGVGTLGIINIKNTDPTNYIDIGATVAGAIAPLIRLKPGEQYPFRLKPGITLRGQANTAAVIIEVTLLEA